MTYLKKKLLERNISQNELARKTGVSTCLIGWYVRGENKKLMTIELAYNIAMILQIPLKEFIEELLNENKSRAEDIAYRRI